MKTLIFFALILLSQNLLANSCFISLNRLQELSENLGRHKEKLKKKFEMEKITGTPVEQWELAQFQNDDEEVTKEKIFIIRNCFRAYPETAFCTALRLGL